MRQNNWRQIFALIIILSLSSTIISSCRNGSFTALPIISKDELMGKAQFCFDLYHSHINAWNSREIENIKEIYSEDIVHFDGIPLFEGIDEVANMAIDMWSEFPKWEMKTGKIFLSDDACLGEWINWGVFTFSEDDPGYEFDILNYRDSQVYFWRALYDRKFLNVFGHGHYIDLNLLNTFAAAWSSDDPSQITEIYSDEVVLTDSLFSISLEGKKAISNYAAAYIAQFPGVVWDLTFPFAEDYSQYKLYEEYPFHPQGGVFSITLQNPEEDSCEIQAVVLITPNDEDKIIEQSIYYDAESLVSCGLAE